MWRGSYTSVQSALNKKRACCFHDAEYSVDMEEEEAVMAKLMDDLKKSEVASMRIKYAFDLPFRFSPPRLIVFVLRST